MRARAALVVMVLAMVSIMSNEISGASDGTADCREVGLVFARGSGQTLGFREAPRFFEKVTDRLSGVSVNAYELGTEAHAGATYPAVGIGFDSLQSFKNLMDADAAWTGPAGGQYRESVTSGVTELTSYLRGRAARCPSEVLVIGGYSQGAQVVGDALAAVERTVRDRIAFVALFGDPKLYLPEGRGPFPSACRGGERSEWRRGNVSCWTDNGILEARQPYMPSDIQSRVGSWCDREDPICNNNPADFVASAHGDYAEASAEMDDAAAEVAAAVAGRLPSHADTINVAVIRLAAGTEGLDVAFVIDTTGSMAGRIGSAVSVADAVGTQVVAVNGRVALTEYRDAFDSFVAEVRVPLTTDIGGFKAALQRLFARGGGDTPEALLSALMTTFDGLDWKPGATKAAVVLTDAGYHDPDVARGWTLSDVAARALAIDPVNVYPVVPSFLAERYGPLAAATAGKVIVDTGNTAAALTEAFRQVTTRPVVVFALDDYIAPVGEAIDFAVDAYDIDSSIVGFDWDVDGDGDIDATTTEPKLSHRYDVPFRGSVEVRARSADGGIGSAVTAVTVDAIGLAAQEPGMPVNLSATTADDGAGTRQVTLTWQAPGAGGPVEGWTVLNGDGDIVARLSADRTSVVVSGVPEGPATFVVFANNRFGPGPPAALEVPPTTAPTSIGITSSGSPSGLGEAVTFTATVTSANGTPGGGTIQFTDGGSVLGSAVPLAGGTASLTVAGLGVGSHQVTAAYSGTGGFASGASAPLNHVVEATITCDADHTISGRVGPRVLGPGSWCVNGAIVNGLTIQPGASVSITRSQVVGPLTSTGATLFRMCGSYVSHALTVSASTGFVLIGDAANFACARNDVGGNMTIDNNTGGVDVSDSRVAGNLVVDTNTGAGPPPIGAGPMLGADYVSGTLQCLGNVPGPTNGGRPVTAGGKTGQCTGL